MAPVLVADTNEFHVHLTGFGPFGKHSLNPSWEAIKHLNDHTISPPPVEPNQVQSTHSNSDLASSSSSPPACSSTPKKLCLTTSLLPVSYTSIGSLLPLLHSSPPDLIVHVGVGKEGKIRLEQCARKWGYDKTDVDGRLCQKGKGGERGCCGPSLTSAPEEMETRVRCERVIERVKEKGVQELETSQDAGLYLCEYTYYTSLALASLANPANPTPIQFIHVPPLNEPYALPELTQAILQLVWAIVNDGGLPT